MQENTEINRHGFLIYFNQMYKYYLASQQMKIYKHWKAEWTIHKRRFSSLLHVPVVASGGVGTLDHIREGLVEGKADAALAASIFHYREYSIKETKEYLRSKGVPVRL